MKVIFSNMNNLEQIRESADDDDALCVSLGKGNVGYYLSLSQPKLRVGRSDFVAHSSTLPGYCPLPTSLYAKCAPLQVTSVAINCQCFRLASSYLLVSSTNVYRFFIGT